MKFFEMNIIDGTNIDEALNYLVEKIIKKRTETEVNSNIEKTKEKEKENEPNDEDNSDNSWICPCCK